MITSDNLRIAIENTLFDKVPEVEKASQNYDFHWSFIEQAISVIVNRARYIANNRGQSK